MTGQDALTFHRPPREYPPAVPSERLRIAPPPTQPPPPHTSLIQILFPVVGCVGLVGFAIVYRSSAFLFIAGAMIVLLLAFSIGMRWSQKRAVRKRAADDARRYAKYLRERDVELAEAGERQRGALARLYPEHQSACVNSLHHQAVRKLGRDLVVEARSSADDVIEAVRLKGRNYVLGVQWHPEFHRPDDDKVLDSGPILEEFLGEARRRA